MRQTDMKTTYINRTNEQLKTLVNATLESLGQLALVKDKRHLTEHEQILMREWLVFVQKNINIIF
jgi:hypothetical protein